MNGNWSSVTVGKQWRTTATWVLQNISYGTVLTHRISIGGDGAATRLTRSLHIIYKLSSKCQPINLCHYHIPVKNKNIKTMIPRGDLVTKHSSCFTSKTHIRLPKNPNAPIVASHLREVAIHGCLWHGQNLEGSSPREDRSHWKVFLFLLLHKTAYHGETQSHTHVYDTFILIHILHTCIHTNKHRNKHANHTDTGHTYVCTKYTDRVCIYIFTCVLIPALGYWQVLKPK